MIYKNILCHPILIGFCLWFGLQGFCIGQTQTTNGQVHLQDFRPSQKRNLLTPNLLTFEHISAKSAYYNQRALSEISRLESKQQWETMLSRLVDYICAYSAQNFRSGEDIALIWKAARLAEHQQQPSLAKELYRLIIKHHRGGLQDAVMRYDTLIRFEKPRYAELSYYYKLVERRAAIDTLTPPKGVLLEMGDEINSQAEEYGMTIWGSNPQSLLFTSTRNSTGYYTEQGRTPVNEDIFISIQDEDGYWKPASPLQAINSMLNEGSPCMSANGEELFFVRNDPKNGFGDCDIYMVKRDENGKWSKAQNLGANVNSHAWDSHPAISSNGDTLFFSSSRVGGFGGTDLWYSTRDAKGIWQAAQNLGPVVNTQYNEVSPFPHSRYGVLYFSSDGHLTNFGKFDIFKSYQINGQYLEPMNVGPLVNSFDDEFYFSIDPSSKTLYYAKSIGDKALNILSFPLPMEAKPNSVVRFTGRVRDLDTGEFFQGIATVIDLEEGIEVAPRYIQEDGSFEFELIDKRRYLLIIEGDRLFSIEQVFYMDGNTDIQLSASSIEKKLTFESIDFLSGSSEILPQMERNLKQVIDFLHQYPHYSLNIIGHTDADGNKEYNLELSARRARTIREYIIRHGGVQDERVSATGKGDTSPLVADAKDEKEKRLNRRVEFHLYKTEK